MYFFNSISTVFDFSKRASLGSLLGSHKLFQVALFHFFSVGSFYALRSGFELLLEDGPNANLHGIYRYESAARFQSGKY